MSLTLHVLSIDFNSYGNIGLKTKRNNMRLKDCIIGTPVEKLDDVGKVGHITGFCYNVHVQFTGSFSPEEKRERTIVSVKWNDGSEYGIHPANIKQLT